MLGEVINDSDIISTICRTTLYRIYTSKVDNLFDCKSRKRRLRCGFRTKSNKYQIVLNQYTYVESNYLTDLKKLTEQERVELINCFLNDDSDIIYQEFHKRYILSQFQRKTTYNTLLCLLWILKYRSNKK